MCLLFAYEAKFVIAYCWWELHWRNKSCFAPSCLHQAVVCKRFTTRKYKVTNKHSCGNWKYLLEDAQVENNLPNNKMQVITATVRNVYLTLISVRSTGSNVTNVVPMCHLLELVKQVFVHCSFFIKYFDHPYLR